MLFLGCLALILLTISLSLLVNAGIAWLLVKGIYLVAGVTVNMWGVILLITAFEILVAILRGGKKNGK